jgi:hypothetical protein
LISFLVNRPIKWDPVKEEIVGDAEASKANSPKAKSSCTLRGSVSRWA